MSRFDKFCFALIAILATLSTYQIVQLNELSKDVKALQTEISSISAEQEKIKEKVDNLKIEIIQTKEEEKEEYKRDIPLSDELQKFTYDTCKTYNVDYDLVLAIMAVESGYNAAAISSNGEDYGLMQINKINHDWLAEKGLTDMLDAKQNITAGIIILAKLEENCPTTESLVMAYNMGESKAKKYLAKGETTEYVEKVLEAIPCK